MKCTSGIRIGSYDRASATNKEKGSHEKDNLSVGKELQDELDVLIECRDVYKVFGGKHVVRDVNFKAKTTS